MASVIKDTGDIRAKLLEVWRRIDDKTISASEARLHIATARAILDTLKVEMVAAHLVRSQIPPMSVTGGRTVPLREQ